MFHQSENHLLILTLYKPTISSIYTFVMTILYHENLTRSEEQFLNMESTLKSIKEHHIINKENF